MTPVSKLIVKNNLGVSVAVTSVMVRWVQVTKLSGIRNKCGNGENWPRPPRSLLSAGEVISFNMIL